MNPRDSAVALLPDLSAYGLERLGEAWGERVRDAERTGLPERAEFLKFLLSDLLEHLTTRDNEFVPLEEAARESGFSSDQLRRDVRSGHVRARKQGRSLSLRRGDLPRKAALASSAAFLHLHDSSRPQVAQPRLKKGAAE